MKKKLVLLLSVILVMCGLLCACGGSSASQITFSSGETLTAKEVKKSDNTSGYVDDKVTIEMTVKEVDAQWDVIRSSDSIDVYYNAYSSKDLAMDNASVGDDVISTLQNGDKIRVSGRIDFISSFSLSVRDVTSIEVIQ